MNLHLIQSDCFCECIGSMNLIENGPIVTVHCQFPILEKCRTLSFRKKRLLNNPFALLMYH